MKILIPVDGSKRSLAAVDFIASRRALVGRDLDVMVLHARLPARSDRANACASAPTCRGIDCAQHAARARARQWIVLPP